MKSQIVNNYVNTINNINTPVSVIKDQVSVFNETGTSNVQKLPSDKLKKIVDMQKLVREYTIEFPNEKAKAIIDIMRKMIEVNNGVISTRMIEPLNISREYLSQMVRNNEIEKVDRGIYININYFQDDFYSFQLRYKKVIFSHMNALYFHGLSEEIPFDYTVTVPNSYHVDTINNKCNVFYVDDKYYELGLCKVKTPNGNMVKAYNLERCICDIIRSKNRMDYEQVKKSVRGYVKRKDKDIKRLSEYAKKMNISDQVMEFVGMYYE